MNDLLVIDGLQAGRPSRERFLEWREGGVGCVHATLAIRENARETLAVPAFATTSILGADLSPCSSCIDRSQGQPRWYQISTLNMLYV